MSTPATLAAVAALSEEYAAACAERDAVNATIVPIHAALQKANAEAEAARVRALELAAQIDAARGGQAWLDLKRRIGRLANSIMELNRG